MSVPDLARLAAEAAQGVQDPWSVMVGLNRPDGQTQQIPVPVGIFLMLGDISQNLARIANGLEQLNALKVANG